MRCADLDFEIAGVKLDFCEQNRPLVVLSIYRSTSGSFDKFLELVIGCLNLVFEQHNYTLLYFWGRF